MIILYSRLTLQRNVFSYFRRTTLFRRKKHSYFKLPEVLLPESLKDWSNLEEIARLDSAVLNLNERSDF
jgi:hypothetical protein